MSKDTSEAQKRANRYQSMYNAYRKEAGADDEEFWKSLGNSGASDKDSVSLTGSSNAVRTAAARKTESSDARGRSGAAAAKTTKRAVDSAAKAEQAREASAEQTKIGVVTKRASEWKFDEEEQPRRKKASKDPNRSNNPDGPDGPDDPVSGAKSVKKSKKKKKTKAEKRSSRLFLVFMVLWVIALLCGAVWLWRYTNRSLIAYEDSQVEHHVDRLLAEFEKMAKDGSVEAKVSKAMEAHVLSGEFEAADIIKQQYLDNLKNVEKFTCQKSKNSYGTTNPVYDIYGDGELVAQMKLESYNPKRILAILEVCDWRIKSINPAISGSTKGYTYTIPSDYTIEINGTKLDSENDSHIVARTEIPKELKNLTEYVSFSTNVTYHISGLWDEPKVVIRNASGAEVEFTKDEQGGVSITHEAKTGIEAPQERYDIALNTAQKWMDFVTNDLTGSNRGLAEIRTYLLKDSFFYEKAEEYAKGIDITFISSHTIENPKYSDLAVTDYTEYNDKCFSIHICFVKNMRLVKGNRRVTSTMDSTFYFVYYDDSDDGEINPHWILADMIAGVKQNYGTGDEEN